MNKFLVAVIVSFFINQSYYCLEQGVEEIISNNIKLRNIKYKYLRIDKKKVYTFDGKIKLTLSEEGSYFQLLGGNEKLSIAQKTKDKSNIPLNLEEVFTFRYEKDIFYLFELKTLNQGVGRNTYNVILTKDKGKLNILFKHWNSSGNGIENSIGILNKKSFILNQLRDSINYYELSKKKFIYKSINSVKVKIDSLGNVCVPGNYKF